MAADISLKIYLPEKLVLDTKVHRISLPSDDMPLTVIRNRAPTLMALDIGAIRLLDENEQTAEEWLIAGGAADIKENSCTVLTEAAVKKDTLNLEKAQALNDEFPNPFYLWLVHYFEQEKGKR